MLDNELTKELEKSKLEIETLQRRVRQLEDRVNYAANSRLPNTQLLSDKFLTRAFAVLGHYIVASLVLAIPFYCLFFLIAMASGGF